MAFERAYIPYGCYWSSPFVRWQGSFAAQHPIELAARVAQSALAERELDPTAFDGLLLGTTVPSRHAFYGGPWLAALLGAPELTGPIVSQACATSARALLAAASEVECGVARSLLVIACDRTSNGPHLVYPAGDRPGARPTCEDWVWDNFHHDPHAGNAMVQTAEDVAAEERIDRAASDEMTLLRYEQYRKARESAFHLLFLVAPLELGRVTVEGDEGIHPTTAEGLANLQPVLPGGVGTFGSQTHPADGNAGLVVSCRETARALSRDTSVEIRLLGWGTARAARGRMAQAVVPAAGRALEAADVRIGQLAAINTHNPFAVNDVLLCRRLGLAPESLNTGGSPLIYGHPQAPTGLRATIELIETLAARGGGHGLFAGCAAGDTAMALALEVRVA